MKYTLKKPCESCPFRTDIEPFLTQPRAREIVHALTVEDATFQCHKTLSWVRGDDDDRRGCECKQTDIRGPECELCDDAAADARSQACRPGAQHCAGAMILLEKIERPNQMMRIAERIGLYDRRRLDMQAPVFDTPEQFIEAQEQTRRRKK